MIMFDFVKNMAAIVGIGFCVFLWQNPNQIGSVFNQVQEWHQDLQEWSEAVREVKERNEAQEYERAI
jgi:hypothetical protein